MANLHLRPSRLVPLIYEPPRKSCYISLILVSHNSRCLPMFAPVTVNVTVK